MVNLIEQSRVPESAPQPLSASEKSQLHQLELIIEKRLTGFIEAGRSLLIIRDQRLYRERYASFAEYCRERFALGRSTCDQLCRSTQVFETLSNAESVTGAHIAPTVPEITLRPLATLPSPDLQAQVWKLCTALSPEGQTPSRTISGRVVRLVRGALGYKTREKQGTGKEKDVMFVRPIQRLAVCQTFNADIACLHVKSPEQAERISHACQVVADRCHQICAKLGERFPA